MLTESGSYGILVGAANGAVMINDNNFYGTSSKVGTGVSMAASTAGVFLEGNQFANVATGYSIANGTQDNTYGNQFYLTQRIKLRKRLTLRIGGFCFW